MRKKNILSYSIFVLLVLVCSASQINAQDKRIEEIRKIYQQTNSKIAQAEKNFAESDIFMTELTVNKGGTMYPAVGIFSQTVKFYYAYGDREKNAYPDRLVKVTVATRRSAREEFSEFVFNENGSMVFYYSKNEEGENRLYFANEKLIRYQKGEKVSDINTGEAREISREIIEQKEKLIRIFINSLE